MSHALVTDLARNAMMVALLVSAPMLAVALIVGLIVSILQTVTQIQEQTLSFVPKIAAMVAAAIFLLPWIGQRLPPRAPESYGQRQCVLACCMGKMRNGSCLPLVFAA